MVSYDFDGCGEGWAHYGNRTDWACGPPTSGPGSDHTGGGSLWATNLGGNSGTCVDSYLESPEIDLSAGGPLRLKFWHWFSFQTCNPGGLGGLCGLPCQLTQNERYSGGAIDVKNAAGQWVRLAPTSGPRAECYSTSSDGDVCAPCELDGTPVFAGSSGGWIEANIDISAYAHASFQVRFRFASYESDPCFPRTPGWYIDDLRITPPVCP